MYKTVITTPLLWNAPTLCLFPTAAVKNNHAQSSSKKNKLDAIEHSAIVVNVVYIVISLSLVHHYRFSIASLSLCCEQWHSDNTIN